MPVSIEMEFLPPHPFAVNMPLRHSIQAESIFSLYSKIMKFLAKHGVEIKG